MRISALLLIAALSGISLTAQDPAQKQALQERVAAIKQSMAQNQTQLKQYSWTETTEISLKGEVKKREQKDCRYGPDGKVQKTAIAAPAEEPEDQGGGRRGRRGGGGGRVRERIVENQVGEMKEYMERVGSLVHRYVPPDPQALQAAFQAGRVTMDKASGSLVIADYAKPGDKVTLQMDPATKKMRSFQVATFLDDPKDAVSLVANFASLPDGTNFVQQSVLDATGKQIQVKTTNSGHRK